MMNLTDVGNGVSKKLIAGICSAALVVTAGGSYVYQTSRKTSVVMADDYIASVAGDVSDTVINTLTESVVEKMITSTMEEKLTKEKISEIIIDAVDGGMTSAEVDEMAEIIQTHISKMDLDESILFSDSQADYIKEQSYEIANSVLSGLTLNGSFSNADYTALANKIKDQVAASIDIEDLMTQQGYTGSDGSSNVTAQSIVSTPIFQNAVFEVIREAVPTSSGSLSSSQLASIKNDIIDSVKASVGSGQDGKDGADGAQGAQGIQGATGQKGDTGAAGEKGKDGKDGKTPVKGVDYFTNAEIKSIETNAATKAGNAVASKIAAVNNSITKNKSAITELEDQVEALALSVENIEDGGTKTDGSSTSASSTDLAYVYGQIDDINTNIRNITTNAASLQNTVRVKKNSFKLFTSGGTTTVDTSAMTMADYVDLLAGNSDSFVSTLGDYDEQITTIEEEIGDLDEVRDSIDTANANITTLTKGQASLAKDYATLATKANGFTKDIANLESETENLEAALESGDSATISAAKESLVLALSKLDATDADLTDLGLTNDQIATYKKAQEIITDLQASVTTTRTELEESLDELSGLSSANISTNGTKITAVLDAINANLTDENLESMNLDSATITKLKAARSELASLRTSVATNTASIESTASDVAGNTENIATNAGDIATNTGNIAKNTADIAENASGVASNKSATEKNASDIATNAGGIAANAGDIATNASGIATNASGVASNKAATEKNASDIATNKSGVASNKAATEKNASDIAENTEDIATNASGVASNKAATEKNASDIATNKSGVATNKSNIATNKNNIASNKNAIAENASDIAANKSTIAQNTSDIASNKSAAEKNAANIAEVKSSVSNYKDTLRGKMDALDTNEDYVDSIDDTIEALTAWQTAGSDEKETKQKELSKVLAKMSGDCAEAMQDAVSSWESGEDVDGSGLKSALDFNRGDFTTEMVEQLADLKTALGSDELVAVGVALTDEAVTNAIAAIDALDVTNGDEVNLTNLHAKMNILYAKMDTSVTGKITDLGNELRSVLNEYDVAQAASLASEAASLTSNLDTFKSEVNTSVKNLTTQINQVSTDAESARVKGDQDVIDMYATITGLTVEQAKTGSLLTRIQTALNAVGAEEEARKEAVDGVASDLVDEAGARQTADTNNLSTAKTYAETKSSDALSSAKTYSNSNLSTAKTYADTKSSDALSSAKTYSNSNLSSAKTYAETKSSSALSDAKTYSNSNLSTAKTYAETKSSDALSSAKTYSNSNLSTAKTYAETKSSDALSSAKTYSNSNLSSAKTYADTKSSDALSSAKTYSDTNLSSAKTYADTKSSDAVTTVKKYSDTNLATAKTYADTKSSAAITTAKSYSDANLKTAKTYADNAVRSAEQWATNITLPFTAGTANGITTTVSDGYYTWVLTGANLGTNKTLTFKTANSSTNTPESEVYVAYASGTPAFVATYTIGSGTLTIKAPTASLTSVSSITISSIHVQNKY